MSKQQENKTKLLPSINQLPSQNLAQSTLPPIRVMKKDTETSGFKYMSKFILDSGHNPALYVIRTLDIRIFYKVIR
ncbi:hypothetical protein CONCODRAFT_14218 [Conidiobolus coronatus NRRL 28638]|uniref:Uncharacterized protein n=1 Tax=Conidiobolus coronatus (strain ATCC 28846 / CBS 209.66 / NRRL 28638) TaxID=796925 RepID=A0A137NPF3_CONC2|nr:hypothetical protein CONCODRAFT_14218 [Conidiobolus coronatus NRRL 28638]|eukprot:KXN64612.1 hypothetical protein CONCODRAFT_14218 [Conidiobolus coronatus NRRL 28638]